MISKIIKGTSFKNCLTYVLGKSGAEIINANIDCDTVDTAVDHFRLSRQLRPNLKKTVCHIVLSLHPNEKLDDGSWQEIFDQYLERMGFTNNQYIGVKHADREHEHIHLVTCRVRLDGSVVSADWDRLRSQAVLRDIEKQYNLTPVRSSWESDRTGKTKSQIIEETETGLPRIKNQIADKVDAALIGTKSISELMEKLNAESIQVKISRDRSGTANGISYKLGNISVAGSRVGRAYSLPQILIKLNSASAIASEHTQDEKKKIDLALIPKIIRENVKPCMTMPEFIDRLKESGVDAHVKYTRTKKIKGISFSVGNDIIPGNELGKEYSWNGLQKYFQISFEPERDNPIILKLQRQSNQEQSVDTFTNTKTATTDSPVLKSKPIPESTLQNLADKIEKLRSQQKDRPVQKNIVKENILVEENFQEINHAHQIAAIARQLLDDLESDNFIGKDYMLRRNENTLTVESLGSDRQVILQVKGQNVEIDNLTESDVQRFTTTWEERALKLRDEKARSELDDLER